MSFKLSTNEIPPFINKLNILKTFGVPTYTSLPEIQSKGNIIYNSTTDLLYFSNGFIWQEIVGDGLNAPLRSIANLITTNDQMIYTTAPDTYATTTLTPFARTLLNDTTSNEVRTTLETIKKPLSSITNSIATFSGTSGDELLSTNVIVSGNNVSSVSNLTFTGTINSVNATELSQLSTIDTTVISSNAWSNMSSMNQDVSSTSTPTFSGVSFTGNVDMSSNGITNLSAPIGGNDITTKSYVDSLPVSGFTFVEQCDYATTGDLSLITVYAEPSDAVQTLTSTQNGDFFIDSSSPSVGQRVLIKNQADNTQNGIYVVTDSGSAMTTWQITRSADFNQAYINTNGSIPKNTLVFILGGPANSNTSWILTTAISQIRPAVSATNVVWAQFSKSQSITTTFSSGLIQVGSDVNVNPTARFTFVGSSPNRQLDLVTPITVPFGGTGQTSFTVGGILIGNGTGAVSSSRLEPIGDFVGISETQTLTNKTLTSNTNTIHATGIWDNVGGVVTNTNGAIAVNQQLRITSLLPNTAQWQSSTSTTSFNDSSFTIHDNVDTTKIAKFDCSSISPGTTRTYRLPDVNANLAYINHLTYSHPASTSPWSSSFSASIDIQRTSNFVTMKIGANLHTLNFSNFISYDAVIPIGYRPSITFSTYVLVVNSNDTTGLCIVGSNGTVSIYANLNSGSFPNSGGVGGHRELTLNWN